MSHDAELLREYVEGGSEEAFRALVERHSGMVHGAALRISRSEPLADDITQAVFIILARKAAGLRPRTVLAGWLYRTTRFVAINAMRGERRRLEREEQMTHISDSNDDAAVWEQIAPELDNALNGLGKTDRDALVLRFLEQQSFNEIARALNTTEAAAKMRVTRALDKLRASLSRGGVVVPAAALFAALSAHGATTAPATLTASIAAAALAKSAVAHSSLTSVVKGALILMAWNKAKIGITAAIAILLLSGSSVAIWKWQSHPRTIAAAHPTMRTFEPMAGEWEGTVTLKRDDRVITDGQPCSMTVTTQQGGRACDIELRMRFAPEMEPVIQHYAHTLNERGDRLFTISDPASARGDGDCEVTESFHSPATGDWRAAMHFPLLGGRGVMDGSWERHGDTLVVRSHDEFFSPAGSSHMYAAIQLRRRVGAAALP
jgi:RNA polymerase sigma factor (sigma-70 family)